MKDRYARKFIIEEIKLIQKLGTSIKDPKAVFKMIIS